MAQNLQQTAKDLHHNVPPDWYESSVKINIGQRYWHNRRFDQVARYSEVVLGKVLDIGSADGFFTKHLLDTTQARQIIGIDVLPDSVKYATSRYRQNKQLRFQVADAHKLPFPKNKFSAVYCLEALEHVYHPKVVLKEIKRVLVPGGYTIILVPHENLLFKLIWFFWTKWRGKVWHDTHLNFYEGAKLPELLQDIGFVHVESHRFILNMLILVKARKRG